MSESVPPPSAARRAYLDRLVDLLPARDGARVRTEVDALILDRAEGLLEQHTDLSPEEAETRAIAALGPAEALAEELAGAPLVISLQTRRAFVRTLWIIFGGHLLLSIVLTAAGAEGAAVPGLLAPLPRDPFAATLLSVLSVFLIDLGAVFLLFFVLHHRRTTGPFGAPDAVPRWTRRDAATGLVMIALLAVIVNVFATKVFAVREGGTLRTFLSDELVAWIPYLNVALACFALRMITTLVGSRPIVTMTFEILGCLAAAAWMVVAATRSEVVRLPAGELGKNASVVLDGLFTRVFLLFLIVGALGLTARAVRMLMQLPRARAAHG